MARQDESKRSAGGSRPGVLRFDFPNFGGGNLRQVDRDEWFETFDERNLVFLFQRR